MKVSVICPTHDRPVALGRAIASVLAQTHRNLELLVLADGGVPGTLRVAERAAATDPRVRVIAVAHHGHPAPLRQLALAELVGDAVAYVDDDDVWRPDHLRGLVEACDDAHPVVVSGADYVACDGSTLRRLEGYAIAWSPEIAAGDPYAEPSRLLHLRGVVEGVGGWRVPDVGLEDFDLWWRLLDAGVATRPVAQSTVALTVDDASRRHNVACGYFVPIHVAGDRARAVAIAERLSAPTPQLRAATLADLEAWEPDLLADARTAWPHPLAPPSAGEWVQALAPSVTGSAALVVVDLDGDWSVALALWCATPEHAHAAERVLRQRQRQQLDTLRTQAARHDATLSHEEGALA